MNLRSHSILHLKVQLRFHVMKDKKLGEKCEEKDTFDAAVHGSLDNAIKVYPRIWLFTHPLYHI